VKEHAKAIMLTNKWFENKCYKSNCWEKGNVNFTVFLLNALNIFLWYFIVSYFGPTLQYITEYLFYWHYIAMFI